MPVKSGRFDSAAIATTANCVAAMMHIKWPTNFIHLLLAVKVACFREMFAKSHKCQPL
jgi:hypothetical protein